MRPQRACKAVSQVETCQFLDPRHLQIPPFDKSRSKFTAGYTILPGCGLLLPRKAPNRPQKLFLAVIFAANLIKSTKFDSRHPKIRTVTGIPKKRLFGVQNPSGTCFFDRSVSPNRLFFLFPAVKKPQKTRRARRVFRWKFQNHPRIAFIRPPGMALQTGFVTHFSLGCRGHR